ncbi:MAG: DUF1559 domain-containing protein [Proteobacteria bacterium]|nr:MAG: DUF1559 domain-containing protein [Pseudomonadota bacterium]
MKKQSRLVAGFTLAEILVVLAIVTVLAALLFPVFARVRENGRSTQCVSNLKQIYLAWQMYTEDSDGRVMPTSIKNGENIQTWTGDTFTDTPGVGALQPWLKVDKLRCPSWEVTEFTADQHDSVQGYGYNVSTFPGQSLSQSRPLPLVSAIEKPSQMFVFADAAHILNYPGDKPSLMGAYTIAAPAAGRPNFHGRHSGWGNVVWADGHIKAMQPMYMTARRKPISLQRSFQVGFLDRDGKNTTNEFFDLNPDAG